MTKYEMRKTDSVMLRIDEETVERAARLTVDVANDLGESPEAWRGANVLTRLFLTALEAFQEAEGHGDDWEIDAFQEGLMTVLAMLQSHPAHRAMIRMLTGEVQPDDTFTVEEDL